MSDPATVVAAAFVDSRIGDVAGATTASVLDPCETEVYLPGADRRLHMRIQTM